jgi:hypothetical protein
MAPTRVRIRNHHITFFNFWAFTKKTAFLAHMLGHQLDLTYDLSVRPRQLQRPVRPAWPTAAVVGHLSCASLQSASCAFLAFWWFLCVCVSRVNFRCSAAVFIKVGNLSAIYFELRCLLVIHHMSYAFGWLESFLALFCALSRL